MSHPPLSTSSPTRRRLLGLFGAASIASVGVLGASGTAHADPGTDTFGRVPKELRPGGEYDRQIAKMAAEDGFSGSILLTHRGRTVLRRSYGMADKARAIPNDRDTVFNIGSIGKFFTAVAIVQLVAQRKISLDATLGTYLDGFPAAFADTVTVHQLLTHTAGFGDHREDPAWREACRGWMTPEAHNDGTLAFILRQSAPLFTPGTRFEYSNSGFWVLGEMVAKVSGQSYVDYIGEHVFAPADMTGSSYATTQQWQTDPAFAHAYGDPESDGGRVDLTAQMAGIGLGGGDGGAFCTVDDLVRFTEALLDGRLLDRGHAELTIGGKFPFGRGMTAYGTLAGIANGVRRIGQGGGDPGFTANVFTYPDRGWVTLFASNYGLTDLRPLILLPDRAIAEQG